MKTLSLTFILMASTLYLIGCNSDMKTAKSLDCCFFSISIDGIVLGPSNMSTVAVPSGENTLAQTNSNTYWGSSHASVGGGSPTSTVINNNKFESNTNVDSSVNLNIKQYNDNTVKVNSDNTDANINTGNTEINTKKLNLQPQPFSTKESIIK